jgi:hypothetical protein
MLTWTGFIANLLNFAATKLLGRTIDVALDKKSRAAKAFYSLYRSLDEVQGIIRSVIAVLDAASNSKKPIIFSQDIIKLAPKIKKVSEDFIKCLDPAISAIQIYDPKLSYLLSAVYSAKVGYVLSLSMILEQLNAEFVIDFKAARNLEQIRYNSPRKTLSHSELEALYQSVEMGNTPILGGNAPILMAEIGDSVIRNVVLPRDFDKLAELKEELSRHLAILSEAQGTLRLFISRTFTIDDLLFLK